MTISSLLLFLIPGHVKRLVTNPIFTYVSLLLEKKYKESFRDLSSFIVYMYVTNSSFTFLSSCRNIFPKNIYTSLEEICLHTFTHIKMSIPCTTKNIYTSLEEICLHTFTHIKMSIPCTTKNIYTSLEEICLHTFTHTKMSIPCTTKKTRPYALLKSL